MAAPRSKLLADLGLPLRALSEALSTIMAAIHKLNMINKRGDLEDSIKGLSRALTSAMATPHRPGSTNLTFQHSSVQTPYWRKIDSTAETGLLSRAEMVQSKLAKLKRASSPSEPLCFKCGDQGHLAAQCYNATLCFICNHHDHRSSQCHAITSFELPKSDPLLIENSTQTLPEPPIHPSHLTHPAAGSESGQQSIPIGYEVSTMVSIKSLEMKLAELKQEMALMKKKRSEMEMTMAGIDAKIQNSQSKLAEIEVSKALQQRSVIREEKRCEDEIGVGICSINKDKGPVCSEKMVYDIEAIRQQVFSDIEAIRQKNLRNHVANLEETIYMLDVNQGVVGDVQNKTLRGGSLRLRKGGLRVLGLSV